MFLCFYLSIYFGFSVLFSIQPVHMYVELASHGNFIWSTLFLLLSLMSNVMSRSKHQ